MKIQSLLFDALSKHVCCKEMLRQAIDTGICEPPSCLIADEQMCEFGQWLYSSDFPAELKYSINYENTRKVHADFHTAAAAIMQLAEIGEKEQARKMILEGAYPIQANNLRRELMNWAQSVPE
jgi:Chemoreceptor zinc-binding domain